VECLDGALDAGGEVVELAQELGQYGGCFFQDGVGARLHGLAVESFYLEEAELEVEDLLSEQVLRGGDGAELLEQVAEQFAGDIFVFDEVLEAGEAVEAVLESVGGGPEFTGVRAGAGGLFGIGAIGGKRRIGHGLLAGWQRTLVRVGS